MKTSYDATMLCIASLIVVLWGLGSHALVDYDEAIYADVLRDSDFGSNVFLLEKDGAVWSDKPPLYFWLMVASSSIFGASEFAFRLPAALFGIGTVLLVWFVTLDLTGKRITALCAGCIMLTIPVFIFGARQVRLDIPLTCMILLAYTAFLKGRREPLWYLLGGASAAAAILTKDLAGTLIAPIIIIHSLTHKEWAWLREKYFWWGTGITLAILLPWLTAYHSALGIIFWRDHFLGHIIGRTVEPILGTQSNWYYAKNLLYFNGIWTIVFLLILGISIFVRKRTLLADTVSFSSLSVFALFLVFFGISRSKLFFYLAPAFPFMAIFMAHEGTMLLQKMRRGGSALATIIFTAAAGALIAQVFFNPSFLPSFAPLFAVADEERALGLLVQNEQAPIYLYRWPSVDTIHYYARGKTISFVGSDAKLQKPFVLIAPKNWLESNSFSESPGASIIYRGTSLAAVRVL